MKNIKTWFLSIFIAISVIGVVFLNTDAMVDAQITPRHYIGLFSLLGLFALFQLIHFEDEIKSFTIILFSVSVLEAMYGLYRLCFFNEARMSGSFDNPAGFAAYLCGVAPYALIELRNNHRLIKTLSWIALSILLIAIALSGSRAGWVATFSWTLVVIMRRVPFCLWKKYLLFVLLVASIVFSSYYIKKDSADGRLLIWRCTINLCAEKPWLGHGMKGFMANYMDKQAEFFVTNPDHKYAFLADNNKYPFNEYLSVVSRFGLLGLFAVLLMALFLVYCYKRGRNNVYSWTALLSLISIAVFSLFSYPFKYPIIWLICCADIFTLLVFAKIRALLPTKKKVLFKVCSLILCFIVGVHLTYKVMAEMRWKQLTNRARVNADEQLFSDYADLEKRMGHDAFFMYNYAVELYLAKKYDKSLEKAIDCRKLWADYDLDLLIGQLYEEKGQYDKANEKYIWASYMCPNRCLPLYYRMKLYLRQDKIIQAKEIAREIIDKDEKVPSPTLVKIKTEADRCLLIN